MTIEKKVGFDNDLYLKTQSEHIRERIAQFGDKLYLEFGGKLFDDYHASRVLPGFMPDRHYLRCRCYQTYRRIQKIRIICEQRRSDTVRKPGICRRVCRKTLISRRKSISSLQNKRISLKHSAHNERRRIRKERLY